MSHFIAMQWLPNHNWPLEEAFLITSHIVQSMEYTGNIDNCS